MRRILFILFTFFSLTASGQFIATTVGGGPGTQGETVDSTAFDRYLATTTFRLSPTGVTIAEITQVGDTAKHDITGSDQPTADTVLQASLDTSLQVGINGDTITDITLYGGQIWYHWINGDSSNYSWVVYTTPNAPTTLTISSPASDTLTYEVNNFSSPANGTVSDSSMVRWDTAAIPTSVTDGYLVYLGDTSVAETDFFIDMADSLEVYVSAFAKNDGAYGTGTWSVAKTDSVFIDFVGVASSSYVAQYDSVLDWMTTDPTGDTLIWQNAMVDSLVANGYWGRMDFFHVEANPENGDGEARLNWVRRDSFNLIEVNSPVWTANEGYTGLRASNRCLNTQYTPSTDVINASASSFTYGIVILTDLSGGFGREIGSDGSASDTYLRVRDGSNNTISVINGSSSNTGANTSSEGIYIGTRRTSGNIGEVYRNGVSIAEGNIFSPTLPDALFYILGMSATNTTDHQVAIDFVMDEVTDAEALHIAEIIEETYLDPMGIGVIP